MEFRFASLLRPETTGYIVSSDWRFMADFRARNLHFAEWAAMFDTYGDGNVQHSHEVPVPRDHFGDFCASLATYILETADPVSAAECLACVADHWPSAWDATNERIRFYRGLRYASDKTRYYNGSDCKVSASESKRHDKRWAEVPSWADGKITTVFALFGAASNSLLASYVWYARIAEQVQADESTYWGKPSEWLQIEGECVDRAFNALAGLVASFKARKEAVRMMDGWKEDVERRTERVAARAESVPA